MARRPAYNTKAEIARRASERAELFAELANLADNAEPLVPTISAYVQFHRRLKEYRELRGVEYEPFRNTFSASDALPEARERWEIAFALSYIAMQANDFARYVTDRAARTSANAGDILRSLLPYTDEELARVAALYAVSPASEA